jgi:CBS domain-containing protein
MIPQTVFVSDGALAQEIQEHFSDDPHRVLPVLNHQRQLVGVMTSGDFLRSRQILEMKEFMALYLMGLEEEVPNAVELFNLEAFGEAYNTLTVKEVMSSAPPVVSEDMAIDEVARVMLAQNAAVLMVMNRAEQVVGSIRSLDLLSVCYAH